MKIRTQNYIYRPLFVVFFFFFVVFSPRGGLGDALKKLIADVGRTPQKRRIRAVLAQEPRRFCIQGSGSSRNAIFGQGLWGESSCSKR